MMRVIERERERERNTGESESDRKRWGERDITKSLLNI